MTKRFRSVCVVGDVTLDCNIARLPARKSDQLAWNDKDQAMVAWERGGAALLADLIEAILQAAPTGEVKECTVCGPKTPEDPRKDEKTPISRSYTVWTPHSASLDKDKKRVWRVSQFLGLSKAAVSGALPNTCGESHDGPPDILVINDADLGFRNNPELWPDWLKKLPDRLENDGVPRWILLKVSRPDFEALLWKDVLSKHADRVVVVCNADGLRMMGANRQTEANRLAGAHISRGISWERTAQDLLWELKYHIFPKNTLSAGPAARCAHAVVSLGAAGAFLFSSNPDPDKPDEMAWLIYDPQEAEGSWEGRCPGQAMGYLSCTAAALTRALVENPTHRGLKLAIQAGIQAYRHLHSKGYGELTDDPPALPRSMAFPRDSVAERVQASWSNEAAFALPIVAVPNPVPDPANSPALTVKSLSDWSILRAKFSDNLLGLATDVVVKGPETALAGVPMAKFGGLRTADRREIENYRSVRSLLCEFIRQPGSKPVSIAVFGPPGSGKSFGVKAIAKELEESQGQPMESRTFNLSQLGGAAELIAALHQVRDIGLSGKLPLVFWDEFDSALAGQSLGWLRLFLEPMQDGTFLEGQVTHPIGKAIFVFAGGTCASLAEFDKGREDGSFRDAKGPDFVSRLRGFLDVLGPNPIKGDRAADPFFVVRRAMLLQSMISRIYPNVIDGGTLGIDPGVLGAFLEISQYTHGARSMESIVVASTVTGKTSFDRSSVPPMAQLDVHVNGREFHSLVQQLDAMENLARAIHDNYCRCLKLPLGTFDGLSEDLKDQNRDAARAMPAKLARMGYAIVPARVGPGISKFAPDVLEKLAEIEHDRWMRLKISNGWRYGTPRDDKARIHPAMLPWRNLTEAQRAELYPEDPKAVGLEELPEIDKQKDRDQFEGLPAMLTKYGCAVIELSKQENGIEQEIITFKGGNTCPLLRDLPCWDPANGFRKLACVTRREQGDNGHD